MQSPEVVQSYIAAGIACSFLQVEGDGRHFDAIIVSDAFEGKRPVQRHQLVYGVLGDRMKEEIHALSIKALTRASHTPKPSLLSKPPLSSPNELPESHRLPESVSKDHLHLAPDRPRQRLG